MLVCCEGLSVSQLKRMAKLKTKTKDNDTNWSFGNTGHELLQSSIIELISTAPRI